MKIIIISNTLIYFTGVIFVCLGVFGGFEFLSGWFNSPGLNQITVDKVAPVMGLALMALSKAHTHT